MSTQRWPTAWLMTDERLGDQLWEALDRAGDVRGGVVFRHYRTPEPERRLLAGRVAEVARRRGITLAIARDAALARELGAALVHAPAGPTLGLPCSRPVHDQGEAQAAARDATALVFVSPVYPTRSHPGAPALGERRAAELATVAGVPAVALGGVDAARWPRLRELGFVGWAGIDAWVRAKEGPLRE